MSTERSAILEAGERVRITDGPFIRFHGTVTAVDEGQSRLEVEVALYGRVARVELAFGQAERF